MMAPLQCRCWGTTRKGTEINPPSSEHCTANLSMAPGTEVHAAVQLLGTASPFAGA